MAKPEAAPQFTTGICEITLQVSDRDELVAFYRDVMGCQVLSEENDRTWLSCGSHARLGIWLPGPKEFGDRGGSHVHFALSAARGQLEAISQRLGAHEIDYDGPIEHPGGDRSSYIEDPAGNVVEVWDFFEERAADAGIDAL